MKSIAKVLSPVLIIALLLSAVAVLAPTGANSVQAEAPIFSDNMESGTGGWTADGFWHRITGAETISVFNVGGAVPNTNTPPDAINDINPDLVTLPDTDAYGKAYLPKAYSGSTSWWYGVDANGTFIDSTFTPDGQSAKNGGRSSTANNGSLISPTVDLTGQTAAKLSFWTWWEVEGVDANSYDMMYVQASTDGINWSNLGNLNPLNDVNNLAEQNYGSGGSNAKPEWVENVFDLSSYAGSQVQVRFRFDTRDALYNGFRGWFIDDVSISSGGVPAPDITDVQPKVLGDPSIIIKILGNNFANGATVKIGDYLVADSAVISSSEIHALINTGTPYGTYPVTVTNPDLQSDSFFDITYAIAVGVAADFSAAPGSGDAPLTVDFTDVSTGTITNWDWDFGDGFTSTQQNPSHTYVTSGTYNVSLTVTGPGDPGTDTESKLEYIVVAEPALLTADFNGTPTVGDAPLTVNFTDQSIGTVSNWLWDFGDDSTSDLQNPSHTYSTPGIYSVSLTVTGPTSTAGDTELKSDYIIVTEHTDLVTPATVEATLLPGESLVVEKKVTVPSTLPMVDVFLLQDETGSYGSYIAQLQSLAPSIFDSIRALVPDSRFGVGGFRDFPTSGWGSTGDWPYRLIQDLTYEQALFQSAVNALTASGGADGPEAQYAALYQAATGAGIDLNSDGAYDGAGEVAAGLNPGFRADALKVVILATDVSFHTPADSGYPGPSRDDVVAALNSAGITVIGIDSGAGAQLQDVADSTGGVVVSISVSGSEVANAILSGLGALTYTVEPVVIGGDPFIVTYDPAVHEDVAGGSTVTFEETITAPEDIKPGKYSFSVQFLANGALLGTQTVSIVVPSPLPPAVVPAKVEATLLPGGSITVEKKVTPPSLPPLVDVFLLQDETGSYGSYIANLQALAPDIFNSIRAMVPDSRFGVGGFRDFPENGWGSAGDWPYRLVQDFTADRTTFLNAVNLLTASGGNDTPEAQYEALFKAATELSFRPDALKVIILATDASFHTSDEEGYPGPSRDDVIAALNEAGITVIGIQSGDISQLQDVASATDGVVVSIDVSGDEVATAVLSGLSTLAYTIKPVVVGAEPFIVTFDPAVREGVAGGSTVTFQETITAPADADAGKYDFTVEFLANGALIGTQEVSIIVPLSPVVVNEVMHSGETIQVNKLVYVPGGPGAEIQSVDVFLLQDETGSYGSYISQLKALAPGIFDAIQAMVPDSRFGVGGFRDFPTSPWGSTGDWPYRLLQDFTTDRTAFLDAVNLLTAGGGYDGPEAQYEGLYQAATELTFRPEARKVVILATDADFHSPENTAGYPGPSRDAVINALNEAGITVIGIDSYYGSNPQLQDVCDATGGINVSLSGTSGDAIADAILSGLGSVLDNNTVKPVVVGAAPLLVTFNPSSYEHAKGDSVVSFTENITVPWSTPEGDYSFTVEFYVNDVLVGTQTVNITVELYPWTMLVYMAGDNSDSEQAYWALQSLGYAPFNMNPALVLFDGSEYGDSRILRKGYEGMVPLDDKGAVIKKDHEVNMGDPETLKNFINWGRSHGHAENYILVLWDKGAGWRTSRFLKDMNSLGDDITLDELGIALAGATGNGENPLEVIGFDASLMQMLEVDYQIAPYALYAVGSEEIVPHPVGGWPYGMILNSLSSDSDLTPAEMAALITEEYKKAWINSYPTAPETEFESPYMEFPFAALSAKDLSQIDALAEATDAFAAELLSSIGKYDAEIAKARAMTEDFGQMLQQAPGSIDLYHFAQLIAEKLPDTSVATAAVAVMDAVEDAVIANVAGPMHSNANGIAIYYPDIEIQSGPEPVSEDIPGGPILQTMVYEPAYDRDVDFAGDTLWDEYLKQAPRLVDQGLLALYIPDVLILAHVYTDPIIRLEWPDTAEGSLADGFTLTKPVDIIVTPEGAIDIGVVALLFSQADLDAADILNTELIGIARSDVEDWSLEKLTMNVPTWLFDITGILGGLNGIMSDVSDEVYPISEEPTDPMMGLLGALEGLGNIILGNGHDSANYIGAVVAVPWLDLNSIAPQVYSVIPNFPAVKSDVTTSLAMIATEQADYLTPIQYPQNLDQGWNLISLPVIPLDNDIETILSGHDGLVAGVTDNVEVVWSYDAATGEWHAYSPAAPEASDLAELNDGAGYWVKMIEDATLTVIGSNFLAGPHAPPEYDLAEGWNLLGYKGILPMAPKGEWYYNEYWDDWSEEYYYDSMYIGGYLEEDKVTYNRLQGYNRVFDSLYTPDFLYPNDGYWIYVSEAGSIPGLNDENWVNAVEFGAGEWLGETMSWAGFWLMHDGDLGLRLAWNGLWYAGWVIAPSEINYGGGFDPGFIPGLPPIP